jgi:ubiquinone/menaquinone biosynthesis C-methylase UbiE
MTETMDWSSQGGSGPENYQSFLVPAMFAPFAETLVAKAGIGPGSRVLDVACGTGAASRAAARRAAPDGSVTGVDLGEPTLAIARAHPPEPDAAPIEYLQGDAAALPVDADSYDVAICQQGFQFFPDRPGAAAAMRAALKPGGRLAIATWTAIESNPFGAIADALERHAGAEAAQMMHSPFALRREELAALIEGAGFGDVDVHEETMECTWAASPAEFAQRAIAAGPIQPLFAAQSDEVQKAVAEDVGARLAPNATADGAGIRMPMTSYVALASA